MTDDTRPGNIFVGRQREMETLTAALEDVLTGQGRLVMLAGEPGIGKTRTVQELASYAEDRGAQVLWGWCYEEEGAPPYWPGVQPIRSYVQQADPDRLRFELGPGAADIAEIVAEIRAKLPGLGKAPELEPDLLRIRGCIAGRNGRGTACRAPTRGLRQGHSPAGRIPLHRHRARHAAIDGPG